MYYIISFFFASNYIIFVNIFINLRQLLVKIHGRTKPQQPIQASCSPSGFRSILGISQRQIFENIRFSQCNSMIINTF